MPTDTLLTPTSAARLVTAAMSAYCHSALEAMQVLMLREPDTRRRRRTTAFVVESSTLVSALAAADGFITVVHSLTAPLLATSLTDEAAVTVTSLPVTISDTAPLNYLNVPAYTTGGALGVLSLAVAKVTPSALDVTSLPSGAQFVHGARVTSVNATSDTEGYVIARGIEWGINPMAVGGYVVATDDDAVTAITPDQSVGTGVVSVEVLTADGQAVSLPVADRVVDTVSTLEIVLAGAPVVELVNDDGTVSVLMTVCSAYNVSDARWTLQHTVLLGFNGSRGTAVCATTTYGYFAGTLRVTPEATDGVVPTYPRCVTAEKRQMRRGFDNKLPPPLPSSLLLCICLRFLLLLLLTSVLALIVLLLACDLQHVSPARRGEQFVPYTAHRCFQRVDVVRDMGVRRAVVGDPYRGCVRQDLPCSRLTHAAGA